MKVIRCVILLLLSLFVLSFIVMAIMKNENNNLEEPFGNPTPPNVIQQTQKYIPPSADRTASIQKTQTDLVKHKKTRSQRPTVKIQPKRHS